MVPRQGLILFQGDSITNAFCKPEEVGTSYRLGAGWATLVGAKLSAEFPDVALRFENRGVCGHTIHDLAARWQTDCLGLEPSLLNILVGINDTRRRIGGNRPPDFDAFEATYARLLEQTRSTLPAVQLVLCEPFALPCGGITCAHREDLAIRQEIVRKLAARYHALFVPLQATFDAAALQCGPAYWLFDGIHPHAAGHWLIAREWLRVVAALQL